MDILFYADEPNASVWLEALQKELPQARCALERVVDRVRGY